MRKVILLTVMLLLNTCQMWVDTYTLPDGNTVTRSNFSYTFEAPLYDESYFQAQEVMYH